MADVTQAQLLKELVSLADAVKRLAEHTAPEPIATGVTEADRIRERVAFSYRALGTLTGRVSTTGTAFDVPVVGAFRGRRYILLTRLPAGANFVELRAGTRTEVLKIHRADRDGDIEAFDAPLDVDAFGAHHDLADADFETSAGEPATVDTSGGPGDASGGPGGGSVPGGDRAAGPVEPGGRWPRFGRLGVIRPEVFVESDPIGSIVVMRSMRGPLVAFGPRLAAFQPRRIHSPV